MEFWLKLKKFFGSSDQLDGSSGTKYIEILRTRYLALSKSSNDAKNASAAETECRKKLEKIFSKYGEDNSFWEENSANLKDTTIWSDAYECDRLLVSLYDDEQVKLELEKRIASASDRNLDFVGFFKRHFMPDATTTPQIPANASELNRILLGQIVEKQQWYDNQMYLKRQYAGAAQRRVAFTFFLSLLLFGVMLIDHFDCNKINGNAECTTSSTMIMGLINWIFGFDFPYGLIVAMLTGLFGASFFMLIQLRQRISEGTLDDARDLWTYRMIMLRCIVGIGAAAILYFFFQSGLLQGSLWPDTAKLGFLLVTNMVSEGQNIAAAYIVEADKYVPNTSFALLVVWSFIAGYSQILVPNLLLQTENRANKAQSDV